MRDGVYSVHQYSKLKNSVQKKNPNFRNSAFTNSKNYKLYSGLSHSELINASDLKKHFRCA